MAFGLNVFGPKWQSLRSLPFQGPKKSYIVKAHLFQWLSKWICSIEIIKFITI
jgi:hypothetical protein